MTELEISILIITGLLILILLPSFLLVKEDEVVIIERLGKYLKTIENPGVYFLIPLIDRSIEKFSKSPFFVSKKVKVKKGFEGVTIITYKIKVVDEMLFVYGSLDSLDTVHDFYVQSKSLDNQADDLVDEVKAYALQFGFEVLDIINNNQ